MTADLDVRLDSFWLAAKTRLTTSRMAEVLYGPNRVLRVTEPLSTPIVAAGLPGGRVVLVPVTTLWPSVYVPGETWKEAFLTRVEFADYRAEGYDVTFDHEAAHQEISTRLEGWCPTGLTGAQIINPVFRYSLPPAAPVFDERSGTWQTSCEYRFEAAPLPN